MGPHDKAWKGLMTLFWVTLFQRSDCTPAEVILDKKGYAYVADTGDIIHPNLASDQDPLSKDGIILFKTEGEIDASTGSVVRWRFLIYLGLFEKSL